MKKFLFVIVLCFLANETVNAEAWCVSRKNCWGFISQRYLAFAKTSVYSQTKYQTGYDCTGRQMGNGWYGNYSKLCENNSKGCRMPQTAECNNSGVVYDKIYSGCFLLQQGRYPYTAFAKGENRSRDIITQHSSGRGSAGVVGEYKLDEDLFNELNDNGYSTVEISGEGEILENNFLSLIDYTGGILISKDADYFSNFKFIVIKEKIGLTDIEHQIQDSLLSEGVFNNIVYSSEIVVTKNQVLVNGLFSDHNGVIIVDDGERVGVRLENFSAEIDLDTITLQGDEVLTLVTIADGGFDISSAIIEDLSEVENVSLAQNNALMEQCKLYPNPTSGLFTIAINSNIDNNSIKINTVDLTGKVKNVIYDGYLNQGLNTLNQLDVSMLPPGAYILEIVISENIYYRKIVIK